MKTLVIEGSVPSGIGTEWEKFVAGHPSGTIFQSPHYFRLFAEQETFSPVAVLFVDENQLVTAVLSGIIQYQLHGTLRHFTSRCIVMGGPLVHQDDPGLQQQILEVFDRLVSRKALYTQFRNLFDMQMAMRSFDALKYHYEDHLNILVDITKPAAELWKEVHKQKRYEIRRADREGLNFKPITTHTELKSSYELLRTLYKRIKLPIYPYQVFENAFNRLPSQGLAAFWGAYLENKLVGTMYIFCYKGQIYDYFAGSNPQYNHKFPNSVIPWQVMLWGKSNGMTHFDWGGAGKPGVPYGVRDYKEKFGGNVVNFGRFEKIHKPVTFRISKVAFKLWQRFNRG